MGAQCTLLCSRCRNNIRPPFKLYIPERSTQLQVHYDILILGMIIKTL